MKSDLRLFIVVVLKHNAMTTVRRGTTVGASLTSYFYHTGPYADCASSHASRKNSNVETPHTDY